MQVLVPPNRLLHHLTPKHHIYICQQLYLQCLARKFRQSKSGQHRVSIQLANRTYRSYPAPTGWSGRFWGRTICTFNESDQRLCITADCGSGHVECICARASPTATQTEFTHGSVSQDFYDVSLFDGYNIPMIVKVSGGSGLCAYTG